MCNIWLTNNMLFCILWLQILDLNYITHHGTTSKHQEQITPLERDNNQGRWNKQNTWTHTSVKTKFLMDILPDCSRPCPTSHLDSMFRATAVLQGMKGTVVLRKLVIVNNYPSIALKSLLHAKNKHSKNIFWFRWPIFQNTLYLMVHYVTKLKTSI